MKRIAICDDEPVLLRTFLSMIESWSEQRSCPCAIRTFSSAKELLFETDGNFAFDLIFLDIEMPGMNGMDLAKEIRKTDAGITIVFLTNYPDFVFEGYEVGAFRYVLKSQAETKLFPMLDEWSARMKKNKEYLLAKTPEETIRLALADMVYLEAQGHDTAVHMKERSVLLREPFSGISGQLGEEFARTHRSYIVNLNYLECLNRSECLLSNGESVPISRGFRAFLADAFTAFHKERRGL